MVAMAGNITGMALVLLGSARHTGPRIMGRVVVLEGMGSPVSSSYGTLHKTLSLSLLCRTGFFVAGFFAVAGFLAADDFTGFFLGAIYT